jgi:hypothetical protein
MFIIFSELRDLRFAYGLIFLELCVAVLVGIVIIASSVQDGFCIACTNLYPPHLFFIGFWCAQSESMAMPRTHSECAKARNIIWCVNCVAALVGIVIVEFAVQEGFCILCTYISHAIFIVLWCAQSESMAMPRTHSKCANSQNIIG